MNVTSEAASGDGAPGTKQYMAAGSQAHHFASTPPVLKEQVQQAAVVEMGPVMLGAQQHHDSAVSMAAAAEGPVLQLRPSQPGSTPEVIVVPAAQLQQQQQHLLMAESATAAAYPVVSTATPLNGHSKQPRSQQPALPQEPGISPAGVGADAARRLLGKRESRRDRLAHGWRCFRVMLLKRALIAQRDWKVSTEGVHICAYTERSVPSRCEAVQEAACAGSMPPCQGCWSGPHPCCCLRRPCTCSCSLSRLLLSHSSSSFSTLVGALVTVFQLLVWCGVAQQGICSCHCT